MTIAALAYMDQLMQSMGIPYAFMRWADATIPDVYFVGEYLESPSLSGTESGHRESTFILRGFTRGDWLLLEQAKANIEANVSKTAILEDGSGIAVFYDTATPISTGVADLKSIKINLNIQEWRVN